MCLEIRKTCKCGKNNAQFHMRDNVLSQEVELARFMTVSKLMLDPDTIRPGYLFDNGYACWLEMYPGEKIDILEERTEIIELQKTDPRRYLQEISNWNIARIDRLKAEGWRKALAA